MGLRDTLPLLPVHDSRDSAASWLLTLRLCNRRSSCPGRSPAGPGLVHTGANHSAFTEPGDTTRKTRTTTLVSGAVPIHYRRPVAEAASGDRWPEDPVVGATTGPTMRRPRLPPGRSPAPTTAGQHRCRGTGTCRRPRAAPSCLPRPGHGPGDSLVGVVNGAPHGCPGAVVEQIGQRRLEHGDVPQEGCQRPGGRAQGADSCSSAGAPSRSGVREIGP